MRQRCSKKEQEKPIVTVGQTLAAARVRRGYTLRQLSELTGIPEAVLHAWEHDNVTVYGSADEVHAHVRSLCAVLGLDAAALLRQWDASQHTAPARPQQWGWAAVVIAAALTLAVLAWPGRHATPDHPTAVPAVVPSPTNQRIAPASPGPSAVPATPPVAAPVTLRITAHRSTWVSVVDSTKTPLFTGVLAAGQTRDWVADQVIHVYLADAGGVHLWVNGHAYGAPEQMEK